MSESGVMVMTVAVVILVVLLLVAVGVAVVATRRTKAARLDLRDAELDLVDAELDVAEQTARLRMVRELHEVAIHSVSLIVSQADGARYKAESDPAAAARAAQEIAQTARTTLTELRRVVAIVRQGEANVSPQPGIKTAKELFRVMREAGLDIRFDEIGSRFDLKRGAELAIYRILQEALSNSLKYGGEGTEVKVSFRWSERGLNVLVDDDGVRAATRRAGGDPNKIARAGGYTIDDDAAALTSRVSGRGITEMRERAELFGGVLNAYAVPGVGFSVSAAFPELRSDTGMHGANLLRD